MAYPQCMYFFYMMRYDDKLPPVSFLQGFLPELSFPSSQDDGMGQREKYHSKRRS